jgi:DNA-entry nuclease
LNDQAENLVTATSYLNKGTVEAGMDDNNPKGMLYYENRLADWLHNHPNYYLDYAVKVSYRQDDLVPYELTLQYVGLDSDGKELQIKLGGRETYISNVTKVTLNNTSPNATIDYTTGTATQK